MSSTAEKTDPKLWEKVKEEVIEGDNGGKPGQWSARKAQLAVNEYKKEGGGYEGERDPHNHLKEWADEDWGTKSGEPSGKTGERYLPKDAREHLSKEEYARSTAKKRADTKKGRQFSAQPEDVAKKTAPYHAHGGGSDGGSPGTRAALYEEAKTRDIPGRSKMSKAQLEKALGR